MGRICISESKVMSTPHPKYLYRYMAFPPEQMSNEAQDKIKRMEALFVESKFYMVCPLWFNDPFDCNIDLLKFDFSDCCDEVLLEIEELKKFVKTLSSPEIGLQKSKQKTGL
ncbi:MAG: hypothetical protein WCI04_02790 [archaeon]